MAMDATGMFVNQQQMAMQQAQQMNSLNNSNQLTGAQMAQENNSTQQQLQTIQQQMFSENQKGEAQRHQMRMETQTTIRQMANDVMNSRLKASDKQNKATLEQLKQT